MPDTVQTLDENIQKRFADQIQRSSIAVGELTIQLPKESLREVCVALRDESAFGFKMLIDLCGVDYLDYQGEHPVDSRFAVVYHLLSISNNQRIRVVCFLDNDHPRLDSVTEIWSVANWFEREAFDLFGILFDGHNDLRRLLTDYGFVGHPFRKDFPLIGNVEMRYDEEKKRVVYEPVSIEARINVPKVIRHDHRYLDASENGGK